MSRRRIAVTVALARGTCIPVARAQAQPDNTTILNDDLERSLTRCPA